MFKNKRTTKEYFSLRKFKGVGLASALVGLAILGSGSVLAEEVTKGVTRDGGVTTITADGATIKLKDGHVTVYTNEQDAYNGLNPDSQSFANFDKAAATEKEKQVLATEEANLTNETTENHLLTGDVTVDYKTKENETVKDTTKVEANTIEGLDREKNVTSAVRGNFGRVIKGGSLDNEFSEVDSNSLKQGVETSTVVSPVKLTKGEVTYHKIDTRVDINKLEYFKNVEMNDVHEDLTTHLLHNEDGSVNYANIKNDSKVWVVEELEDGSYGKFMTITKTDATNNESVISDFTSALPTAQKFTDANVKAAGGIQKPDYLLVLERNTFARIENAISGAITGVFSAQDIFASLNTLVPSKDSVNELKHYFTAGFLSKRDAEKRLAEIKKQPKLEAKDSKGRPTKNWTMHAIGTTSTTSDTTTYVDADSLESAISNQNSKYYNMYDAVNGKGDYKGTPIPMVGERKLVGSNKDLTVDYIWDNSTSKPQSLTPELRTSLESMIQKVNEDKANQANAIYDNEVPEGVKFERIVVEFESNADSFAWEQVNGEYRVRVQDFGGDDQSGSGLYGEYTLNGQKHRVRISNMYPISVQPALNGLFDTEYNDIFMVNRAYKKVDSSAHVTNIYAKEQTESTEKRGTTTVKYVDEEGNTLKEDVTGPNGVVSNRVVKFYLDKDGQRQVVSDETTPTNNTYDVSTEQYKPTSLEKDGKVYGYARTDGAETGKLFEGNTVVTYVYKMKKAPLNVNYYLENTTTSLAPSENQADLLVKSDYTTQAKEIPSKTEVQDLPEKTVTTVTTYELVGTPDNANGNIAEGGTTVNYFYRAVVKTTEVAKQAPVTANYYLEGTTDKLAPSDEQGQKDIGSAYTTETKTIAPKVVTQDLEDRVITTTTTYELVSEPTDKNGNVPVGGKVVNYFYRAVVKEGVVMKQAPVTVNYFKEGTTEKLADSIDQGQKDIGSKYTSVAKVIPNKVDVQDLEDRTVTTTTSYELVAQPTDKEGTVPVGGKVINYFYHEVVNTEMVMKKAPVLVNYFLEGTETKLADSDNQGEKVIGTDYTSNAKTIEPKVVVQDLEDRVVTTTTTYELVSEPTNKEGKVPVGGTTVNYYYRPVVKEDVVMKKAPVIVNYYLDGTTTKLADSDDQGQLEIGSEYSSEVKDIPSRTETEDFPDKTVTKTISYILKEVPEDAQGEVPVGGKVINYYYVEDITTDETPKQAPLVANYYLEGTTDKLADSEDYGEQNIGSTYSTEPKEIEPKVETVETDEKTTVTTTRYELVEEPANKEGQIPAGGEVVNYYYRAVVSTEDFYKSAPVVANYFIQGTSTKLADSDDKGELEINSAYSTSAKEIPSKTEVQDLEDRVITKVTTYQLVETPADAEGTVPVGGKVVNYYYRPLVRESMVMKETTLKVNYLLEGTRTALHAPKMVEGLHVNSIYNETPLTFDTTVSKEVKRNKEVVTTTKYELVGMPNNSKGRVPATGAVVDFFYRTVVTVDEYPTIPNDAPKLEVPEYNETIAIPGTPEVHTKPEFTGGVVPNEAPMVDVPEYDKPIGIPGTPEVHEKPEFHFELPKDAPKVEIPEFKGGVVPNEAPVLELPELKVPEEPAKPQPVPVPTKVEENVTPTPQQPVQEAQLPNTGGGDSAKASAFGIVSLLAGLGIAGRKRKGD